MGEDVSDTELLTSCESTMRHSTFLLLYGADINSGPVGTRDPRTMDTQHLSILVTVLFNFHRILMIITFSRTNLSYSG